MLKSSLPATSFAFEQESRMLAFWMTSEELYYWYDNITAVNSLSCVSTSLRIRDYNRVQAIVQQHSLVVEYQIFCHICCMELNSVSNAFSLPYYVSVYMYHNLQTSPPTQVLEATQVEQLLLPCRCCSCAKLACSCILVRRYALFHSRQIYAHKRTMKPPKPVKKYFSTKRMNMKPRWVYPTRGETVALPYQRICFCVERRSKEVSPCVKCYCDIRGAKM